MSQITITNLTFAYEGSYDTIFEDVSLRIDTRWKLGMTGRNGRGKTTFLRLLQGKYSYQGTIHSPMAFDYFPFETEPEQLPIELVEQIAPDYEYWKLQRELSLLHVDEEVLYRPFQTLSQGEQTKVMLAALFLKEDHFLLIDEPTNHLDARGREVVCRYLQQKSGFILVSHDRAFLDQCVDHILSINRTDIQMQQGNFSSWYQNKQREDQFELSENEKYKKEIRRLNQSARQAANWSDKIEKTKNGQKVSGVKPDKGHIGRQAAKMMKRSKHAQRRKEQAAEEKQKLLKNLDTADELKLEPLKYHSNRLIAIDKVSVFHDEKKVCNRISFSIEQGDRIALQGKNGSGKSSLLNLISGKFLKYEGHLQRGSQLKVSCIPQEPGQLQGTLDAYVRKEGIPKTQFITILRKLDFSREQLEKEMDDYSEGQKKKVLIARSLCEQAHLYIWDEPLNYVDVLSRIQIEDLILTWKPTLVFVEHDREFREKIATKVISLDKFR